jgi:hypothetical protein
VPLRPFAIAVVVAGCGRAPALPSDTSSSDGAADAAMIDAAFDAAADATPDAMPDVARDAPIDAGGSTDPCNKTFTNSEIVPGPVTIAGPADIMALQGKRAITGTLTIAAPIDVDQPAIEYVGGALELDWTGTSTRIALPALCHIGGRVRIGGQKLASVDLTRAREIGGELDVGSPLLRSLVMPSLVTIDGPWWINSQLTELAAPNLTTIRGKLLIDGSIYGAIPIPTLSRLGSLTDVTGIDINNDPELVDLTGLEHVRSLPIGLQLTSCTKLQTLHGLQLDPGPTGDLVIVGSPYLRDISPLSAVTKVVTGYDSSGWYSYGYFSLAQLPRIVDLSPVANITSVDARATISSMANLTSIDLAITRADMMMIEDNPRAARIAMPNLTVLGTDPDGGGPALIINNSAALTSIAFPALSETHHNVVISDNPMLPTCQATALQAQVNTFGWPWYIGGNGTGTCPHKR